MDGLVAILTAKPGDETKADDDFVDRLSNKYTIVVLLVFAAVVMGAHVVGDPINCWSPQHFTDGHSAYTNAYCWVKNTYRLAFEEEIPKASEEENHNYLTYYQWIPFILIGQGILFLLPSMVWHAFNQIAGVDADNILDMANSFNKAIGDRDGKLQIIGNQMDRFLTHRIHFRRKDAAEGTPRGRIAKLRKAKVSSPGIGWYMVALYIFSKFLYLVNVVVQLFLLNKVLAVDYSVYGIEVAKWIMSDEDGWTTSPQVAFPRVSMCDFNIRRLGNVHRYTVQCTLPLNLYNEKVFMFLWFWMVFIAIATTISLITWIVRAVSRNDQVQYIFNHLKMMERIDGSEDSYKAEQFTSEYLRQDGVFLLRLIGHNSNTITVSEIIATLWDNWKGKDINDNPTAPPPPASIEDEDEEAPILPPKLAL